MRVSTPKSHLSVHPGSCRHCRRSRPVSGVGSP